MSTTRKIAQNDVKNIFSPPGDSHWLNHDNNEMEDICQSDFTSRFSSNNFM